MNGHLDFAKELAEEAGKIMLQYFRSDEAGTSWKEDSTPLTIADTKINSLVASAIKKNYPHHGLIGEEESIDVESDYIWLCDPIDGTTPYSHGIPISTFNLALVYNGQVIVSVVFDPFSKRLYEAEKGKGAKLNGKELNIQEKVKVKHSREAVDIEVWGGFAFPSVFADPYIGGRVLDSLRQKRKYSIFHLISVAFPSVLIASGEMDGVVFSGTNPWDMAAASLIIQEAGGVVTDIFGDDIQHFHKEVKGVLAGTRSAHRQLLHELLPIFKEAKDENHRD